MPIYNFICPACNTETELFLKFKNADEEQKCETCGGTLSKTVSSSNFVLKGNSWAKNGYSAE